MTKLQGKFADSKFADSKFADSKRANRSRRNRHAFSHNRVERLEQRWLPGGFLDLLAGAAIASTYETLDQEPLLSAEIAADVATNRVRERSVNALFLDSRLQANAYGQPSRSGVLVAGHGEREMVSGGNDRWPALGHSVVDALYAEPDGGWSNPVNVGQPISPTAMDATVPAAVADRFLNIDISQLLGQTELATSSPDADPSNFGQESGSPQPSVAGNANPSAPTASMSADDGEAPAPEPPAAGGATPPGVTLDPPTSPPPTDPCSTVPIPTVTIDDPPTDVREMDIITIGGTVVNGSPRRPEMGDLWVTVDYQVEQNADEAAWSITGFYLDDGEMAIKVSGGHFCGEAVATTSLDVANVAPVIESFSGGGPIDEGSTAVLTIEYSDAHNRYGTSAEAWTLVVDWGDGKTSSFVNDHSLKRGDGGSGNGPPEGTAPAKFTRSFEHRYKDDAHGDRPTPNEVANYPITVSVSDGKEADSESGVITVNNVAPKAVITSAVPLDNAIQNGQIDESEGFTITGTVEDPGVLDTHTAVLTADLNWDGDFSDPGETSNVTLAGVEGQPGKFTFEHTIETVPDDGGSPGNGTLLDDLTVAIRVTDDDTGVGTDSTVVSVHNVAPEVLLSTVAFDVVYDNLGNVAQVRLRAAFRDIGTADKHVAGVKWGDGTTSLATIAGNGATKSLDVTRNLPPSFGQSAIRLFPILLKLRDDDLGEDALEIHGDVVWSFDKNEAKNLAGGQPVQQLSQREVGLRWIGYWTTKWEINFNEVVENSSTVSGSSWVVNAWNKHGSTGRPDFTSADRTLQAAAMQTFSLTCDRETGVITRTYSHGSGQPGVFTESGDMVKLDGTKEALLQTGAVTAFGAVDIVVVSRPHLTAVTLSQKVEATIADGAKLFDRSGVTIGEGTGFIVELGKTATYGLGQSSQKILEQSYKCRERIVLSFRRVGS